MKAVILAGGYGTRISEETHLKPKPMIEIGGKPILWHIMKIYSHYGINEFIICLGYKSHVIKEYFYHYLLHMSDVTIDMSSNTRVIHHNHAEPWKVTLIDTGEDTMTGGRLKRVQPYVGDESFCFTYGDGLSDVDIGKLIDYHRAHGKLATLTAVQPPGRFGTLHIQQDQVISFTEKPDEGGSWINGGFFILEPGVFPFIDSDANAWEKEPIHNLVSRNELAAYRHQGFWQPMDTLRDRMKLEELWKSNSAPWKVW